MEGKDGLCFMSLDGGGVRGLSTLYILESIMIKLNHERSKADLPAVKPCQIFDLIAGTSTGGLIAIMLGRLEMDVDECIAAYIDLTEDVFGERQSRTGLGWKTNLKAQFSSQKLRDGIEKVLRTKGVSKDELLNDGKSRGCKVFVCSCDRANKDIVRLKSYDVPGEVGPRSPPSIVQAALATSAAPRYFDSVAIGDVTYLDGGLGANNPVYEVGAEASDIWFRDIGIPDLQLNLQCFISIGTGNPGMQPVGDDKAFKFLQETLVEIATETEKTANSFARDWRKPLLDKKYFRFNVEQGLQGVGLDEYKKKGVLESMTRSYLSRQGIKVDVSDCVRSLKAKQNPFELGTSSSRVELKLQPYHPTRLEQISERWSVNFGRLCTNIFERISKYDVDRVFNSIHYQKCPQSTKWITTNEMYQEWKNEKSACLWLTGKIGSGKTFLTTTIIQDLRETGFVGHFFFRSADRTLLDGSDLFRSYVLQIVVFLDCLKLDCPQDVTKSLTRLFGPSSTAPLIDDILYMVFLPLQKFLAQHCKHHFFVVDGLDECSREARRHVLKGFRMLKEEGNCHIYISSRDDVAVQNVLIGTSILQLSENLIRDDISAFIDWKMEEKTEFDGMLTANLNLLEDVKKTLNSKAHLMTLWVNLQIEALWDCNNDSEIRYALRNLPKDLLQTYQRCIERLKLPLGMNTLRWVCATIAPFHIDQLREVLALNPVTGHLDKEKIPERTMVLKACASLIVVNEDNFAMPTHHSAVQFLAQEQGQFINTSLPFDITSIRLELGGLCVVHLTGPDYSLNVARKHDTIAINMPSSAILPLSLRRFPGIPRWNKSGAKKPNVKLHIPRHISKRSDKCLPPVFYFAKEQWGFLTRNVSEDLPWWHLFKELALQSNACYDMHPWKNSGLSLDSHYVGLLGWAITRQHNSLLKVLMSEADPKPRKEIFDLPLPQYSNRTPVELAILSKNLQIFRILFQEPQTLLTTTWRKRNKLRQLLRLAALVGFSEVVDEFSAIDHTLVSNSEEDDPKETPLVIAATQGHQVFVSALCYYLEQSLSKGSSERTGRAIEVALLEACERGHDGVLEILLDLRMESRHSLLLGHREDILQASLLRAVKKNQVEIIRTILFHSGNMNTPRHEHPADVLILATSYNHDATVRMLLNAGVDTEASDSKGRTPLHIACEGGHETVARLLITHDASTQALNGKRTVLHSACIGKNEKIVQALLEKDPTLDLEARDEDMNTPFLLAALNLSLPIVDYLLVRDVDVRAVNVRNWSSVQCVVLATNDRLDSANETRMIMITMLLERMVDIDNGDFKGATALHFATTDRNVEMVRFLLDHGASVNVKDEWDETALDWAIRRLQGEDMIELLVKKGADLASAHRVLEFHENDAKMKTLYDYACACYARYYPQRPSD